MGLAAAVTLCLAPVPVETFHDAAPVHLHRMPAGDGGGWVVFYERPGHDRGAALSPGGPPRVVVNGKVLDRASDVNLLDVRYAEVDVGLGDRVREVRVWTRGVSRGPVRDVGLEPGR